MGPDVAKKSGMSPRIISHPSHLPESHLYQSQTTFWSVFWIFGFSNFQFLGQTILKSLGLGFVGPKFNSDLLAHRSLIILPPNLPRRHQISKSPPRALPEPSQSPPRTLPEPSQSLSQSPPRMPQRNPSRILREPQQNLSRILKESQQNLSRILAES